MNAGTGKAVKLSPEDNVMVAMDNLNPDTDIENTACHAREMIPVGHKVATRPINAADPIIKYGQIIGLAAKAILPGTHVHTHNTNMLCFTTGRRSVCGFKPVPTLKLATNSEMYRRMGDDMDVNCGLIIDGHASIETMAETIFDLILETASGKKSKSEQLGFGANEFVPWHIGAIL